jgi:hypothetical protein
VPLAGFCGFVRKYANGQIRKYANGRSVVSQVHLVTLMRQSWTTLYIHMRYYVHYFVEDQNAERQDVEIQIVDSKM